MNMEKKFKVSVRTLLRNIVTFRTNALKYTENICYIEEVVNP